MERGDYVNPQFNYEPRINKPVLSYWIVTGFYKAFGVSVGVQRIPIAIGGIVLIATAFFLARAASASGRSTMAAWWAAVGLAVSPRHLMFSRRIFIDIYISMFMALTLLFFALSERYPARRRLFLVLMYVSVGLGVLTKGPVAVLLPGLAFGAYLIVHGELRRLRDMMIPMGLLIGLAIVVPWYAALYQQSGWAPIKSFIFGENLARYVEGAGVNADRPVWWYLPVVLSDSFPWSLFLFPAAVMWLRDRRGSAGADAGFRIRTLLWIWILVIVGFFSLSAGKQDLYIYPIVPAIVSAGWRRNGTRHRSGRGASASHYARDCGDRRPRRGGWCGFLALFNTSLAVYTLAGSAAVGVIAIAGGTAAMFLAVRRRESMALTIVATSLVAVNWIFVSRMLPSFEAYKPAPALAAILEERAAPEDLIVTYNVALPSLVYYLRRHTDVFYDHGPVLELLGSRKRMFLLVYREDYERAIKPVSPVPLCQIGSRPTFDVKLQKCALSRPAAAGVVADNRLWKPAGWCTRGRLAARCSRSDDRRLKTAD